MDEDEASSNESVSPRPSTASAASVVAAFRAERRSSIKIDPDPRTLYHAAETGDLPGQWDVVRRWLRQQNAADAAAGAAMRGEYGTTALHVACRKSPPLDIVVALISACPDVVGRPDDFGWLPLHYGGCGAVGRKLYVIEGIALGGSHLTEYHVMTC